MQTLVVDSNVWIDLYNVDLLDLLFGINYQITSPDIVIGELNEPIGTEVLKFPVFINEIPGSLLSTSLMEIRSVYPQLSAQDAAVLFIARHITGTILTNEGPLRKAAVRESIGVHGVIWLLDECVTKYCTLDANRAISVLDKIIEFGAWMPLRTCDRYKKKWERLV